MEGYLGEFAPPPDCEFLSYGQTEWAMHYIAAYGGIDGSHHKTWALDQVARILKGTPVLVTEARWEGGQTKFRYKTGEPSKADLEWVAEIITSDDEEDKAAYEYDVGISP